MERNAGELTRAGSVAVAAQGALQPAASRNGQPEEDAAAKPAGGAVDGRTKFISDRLREREDLGKSSMSVMSRMMKPVAPRPRRRCHQQRHRGAPAGRDFIVAQRIHAGTRRLWIHAQRLHPGLHRRGEEALDPVAFGARGNLVRGDDRCRSRQRHACAKGANDQCAGNKAVECSHHNFSSCRFDPTCHGLFPQADFVPRATGGMSPRGDPTIRGVAGFMARLVVVMARGLPRRPAPRISP
jgi:hypothetical protein